MISLWVNYQSNRTLTAYIKQQMSISVQVFCSWYKTKLRFGKLTILLVGGNANYIYFASSRFNDSPRYGQGQGFSKIWSGARILQDMVRGKDSQRYGQRQGFSKLWSGARILQDMVRGKDSPRYYGQEQGFSKIWSGARILKYVYQIDTYPALYIKVHFLLRWTVNGQRTIEGNESVSFF